MKLHLTQPKFYGIWANMKQRCDNPTYKTYSYYGGRGIKYDPKWASIDEFYKDMFQEWQPGLTLERKNNNLGYSKKNCKWTTMRDQANNRRSNQVITHKGLSKTVAEWARELNIEYGTLYSRYVRYGWPVDRCLTSETF